MDIGIIGLGVVGSAISSGFTQIGHSVKHYDIKDCNSSIENLLSTDMIYICVPTNNNSDGSCNVDQVLVSVEKLNALNYLGIIAIKSTVPPGTTQDFINKFTNLKICMVPEFLRERSALSDFIGNHDVLIVGTNDETIFNNIVKCHSNIPKKSVMVSPTEAEITKYFNNVYNAMRITFANGIFEVCEKLGADYQSIFSAITNRDTIGTDYLRCSEYLRGYAGACLPKDSRAFAFFLDELGIDLELFRAIVNDNQKHLLKDKK